MANVTKEVKVLARDFMDSDDEEETWHHKNTTRKKKDEEKELKNEIMELEKTFEKLDIEPKSSRNRGGLFRSSTLDESSSSYNNRPQRVPTRPPPLAFGTPVVSKPLKFSWEETRPPPIVDKSNEEWNYQQVSHPF